VRRQKVLALWLQNSSLDAAVVAWALWDGTGEHRHMPGDADEPPYATGLDALLDGWRLIQSAPLVQHPPGTEYTTGYLKYEFLFERLVDVAHGDDA
jgi:hypothetical protein